ncbi:MAG: hypothetical protein IJW59_05065 [Clostridia bacterium]|nr:hypothetical protein [Clostridia bacterium]
MNKLLKAGIVALSSAVVLMGCGGKDPTTEEPKPVVLTAEESVGAYTKLRSVANKPLYDTNSSTGSAVSVGFKYTIDSESDFSKSGLASDDVDELKNDLLMGFLDINNFSMGSSAVLGYKNDCTGYMKASATMMGMPFVVGNEVTKKVGNEYLNYYYDNTSEVPTKTVSKVDAEYAKNTYVLAAALEDGSDKVSLVDEVVEAILGNTSYSEFQEDATILAKELILNGSNEDYISLVGTNLNITQNAQLEFTKTGDIYELKVVLDIDNYSPAETLDTVKYDFENEVNIKFDDESIKSIKIDVDIDSEVTSKCSERLGDGSEYGVTFTDDNTITQEMDLKTSITIEPKDFEESQLSQNFDGYKGTGFNDAIENRVANVIFEPVNTESNKLEELGYGASMGNDLIAFFNTIVSDELDLENVDVKLYWDKECLNEVSSVDVVPSYDVTLYYKIVARDGYSYVEISLPFGYNGWTILEDTYLAESVIDFADYLGDGQSLEKVLVNGEEYQESTITLENTKVYQIKLYITE